MKIQDKYLVPPYKIQIGKDKLDRQFYTTEVVFDVSKYSSLTNTIEKQILNDKGFLDLEVVDLQFLLKNLQGSIEEKLKTYSLDNSKLFIFIRDWMSYKIIGLERLMPLLIDDRVQEIYLDKPNTPLYLDHQDFGRCITNIILSEEELNQFKTRLCLEKDVVLNILNPSLKVELKTNSFHIRAAIDIPPGWFATRWLLPWLCLQDNQLIPDSLLQEYIHHADRWSYQRKGLQSISCHL